MTQIDRKTSLPEIKAGDVLFVFGDDFVANAIQAVTGGPAHCAMFIDGHMLVEAQIGRPIGDCLFSSYAGSTNRLEIWRDETLTDDERVKMVAYAKTQYGVHYDLALIPLEFVHFEFGVPIGWYHEHGRICSTYVCDVAAHVGKRWSKTANPAPIDDMDGGVLKRIYTREAGKWEPTTEITVSAWHR